MKKTLFLSFFVLIIVLSGFATGTTETNVDSNQFKVVSLAPNVTEIICALDAQEHLVGRTTYCNYPEDVKSIQDIGDMYDPNLEVIISLQPNCVIASSIISPSVVEQLNNYGIKTYQFFHEYEGLNGTFTLISEIGEVIGKQKEANTLINKLKDELSSITSKTNAISNENPPTCAILITWGEWGDYAATGDTFVEDIIVKSGAINIASSSKYWAISKELLLSENPDYIFITDNSNYVTGDIVKAFKNTVPYSSLKASLNNNVYVLNADELSRQSVRSFDVLKTVAKTIQPELLK